MHVGKYDKKSNLQFGKQTYIITQKDDDFGQRSGKIISHLLSITSQKLEEKARAHCHYVNALSSKAYIERSSNIGHQACM